MKANNISLGARLWISIAVVISLMLATLLVGTSIGAQITNKQDAIIADHFKKVAAIDELEALVEVNSVRINDSLLGFGSGIQDLYRDQLVIDEKEIKNAWREFEAMKLSPETRTLLAQASEFQRIVNNSRAKAFNLKSNGQESAVLIELKTTLTPATNKYLKYLKELSNYQKKEYVKITSDFVVERDEGNNVARAMVAFVILIMLAGTKILVTQVRRPLEDVIVVARTIAQGDLTVEIDTSRTDEFGKMMRTVADMRDQLSKLVANVRRGVDEISHASVEIESGNHDLSNRTEQTAANLEETAASMQDLTVTVKQTSDSARNANSLAESATRVAQNGGAVTEQVVAMMNDMNTSSRKIFEIISVVDSIAFQTNILALNAAVEAARAGEQGRGFAVVAAEVRSLAGRSAEAAREVKELITNSVGNISKGTELVSLSGNTMQEIISAVENLSHIMREITSDTVSQADSLAQVNSAVEQLDRMTQQNANLVEQSTLASVSMKNQASLLADTISAFKVR